ncbi:MAG: helix-turn-helix domain-containing protein [Deinococcota bacterium]|jgi:hypothetical protein|nr:helix-turn-helix domain-containing protein [Deinococcota bacterium]
MTFAELGDEVGANVVLEAAREPLWLEEGEESRPPLLLGALWVTTRAGLELAHYLSERQAAGLWCTRADRGVEEVCRKDGLGLAFLSGGAKQRAVAQARSLLAARQGPALLVLAGMVDALAHVEQERELLERLHHWLRCPLALIAPWGEPLAWVGALPPRPPAQAGQGPGHLALRAGEGLLVAFGPAERLLPWRGLLELAARLIAIKSLEGRAQRAEEESLKAALLDDLLVGEADPSRARTFGFEAGTPFVLALLEAAPILGRHRLAEERRRETLLGLRRAAGGYLERLGVPYLLSERGGRAAVLWQSFAPEAETATLLKSLGEGVRLGYSARHQAITRVPQGYREALIALKTARLGEAAGFAKLDPVSWVLLQQSPEDLRALVERFLPLPEPLLRTLEEWLAGEGNQAAAAERLHVHVNTLRYRLGRVEASLGLSLKSPAALARIHLALRAKGLLEEEG